MKRKMHKIQLPVASCQLPVKTGVQFLGFSMLFILCCLPSLASAQYAGPYVPVVDKNMETVFPDLIADNEDSIRNIIAAPEPGGVTLEGCVQSPSRQVDLIQWYTPDMIKVDPNIVGDTGGGPWYRASVTQSLSAGPEDQTVKDPLFFQDQANTPREIGATTPLTYNGEAETDVHSSSIRCLLISQIEWQKLSINIQIHAMLRDYIAQAQNHILNKELGNKIAAATQEFSKRGLEICTVDPDGDTVCTDQPVSIVDEREYLTTRTGNQVRALADQVTNGPNDPAGSLNVCLAYQLDVKRSALMNARAYLEGPGNYARAATACTSDKNSDPEAPFNDPYVDPECFFDVGGADCPGIDGTDAFNWMLGHPQDAPLSARSGVNDEIARSAQEEKDLQQRALDRGNGSPGDQECNGDATDNPYCTKYTTKTSGKMLSDFEFNAASQGDRTRESSDSAFDFNTSVSENQSQDVLMNGGFVDYPTKDLGEQDQKVQRALNELPRELWRTAEYGYWNTPQGLTRWTQATMLTIYDEMLQKPEANIYTATPEGGGDVPDANAVDVGY